MLSKSLLCLQYRQQNEKSYGIDGISNVLLKSISNEIINPLTLIINQSLETRIFPNAFKTSKVIPIYKKGDKANLNNYRPISMLPTISKIFELVIHMQLYAYFCENNLLCEQQYGFRSKHSTELALIKLVDYLLKQMDANQISGAIYLHLSKAFDTLNFDILLRKLKFYGDVGTPLKLLNNYLRNIVICLVSLLNISLAVSVNLYSIVVHVFYFRMYTAGNACQC